MSNDNSIAIKEIKFHEEEDKHLIELFNALTPNENGEISADEVIKKLCSIDYTVAGLDEYVPSLLTDDKLGHWDIYRDKYKDDGLVIFRLDKEIFAKNPVKDIIDGGIVAIDFGTKSTVAAYLDKNSYKRLIKIGKLEVDREGKETDYENPTMIEFRKIKSFMDAYNSCISRPHTEWNDISISHTAEHSLEGVKGNDFYRFFNQLKQWAADDEGTNIRDTDGIHKLKCFVEIDSGDIDPIEIYAYYIGRYINQMHDGQIFLEYYLSYPVKYDKKIRDKIKESFERGIKKSIPKSIFNTDKGKDFRVSLVATEPAAYAISALQEYGFRRKDLDKPIYYGVFDFGGGTTDFDFGIWKKISEKQYRFEIKHFGADGDENLGGEKLLELLAYKVFEKNADIMTESQCNFTLPKGQQITNKCQHLIAKTLEAQRNMQLLIKKLREILHDTNQYREKSPEEQETTIEIDNLLDKHCQQKTKILLNCNYAELIDILKHEIKKGVEKFFSAFNNTKDKMEGIDKLHIFLGGNASRCILVKEAFEELMKENADIEYELYPPLGTEEAEAKKKEMGITEESDDDISKTITCKTGVAFGLLDGRKKGTIKVSSEITENEEAKFKFFLGQNDGEDKFEVLIDKKDITLEHIEYGNPIELLDYTNDEFDLYYTADARATTGNLSINESKKITCKIDPDHVKDDHHIYIKIVRPNTIKYMVVHKDDINTILFESENKVLKD